MVLYDDGAYVIKRRYDGSSYTFITLLYAGECIETVLVCDGLRTERRIAKVVKRMLKRTDQMKATFLLTGGEPCPTS